MTLSGDLGFLNSSTPSNIVVDDTLYDVTVGNLIGTLLANGANGDGAIQVFDVKGAIGDPGNSAAGSITTTGRIRDITAGVVYGMITVGAGGTEDIGSLVVTTESGYTGGGHFYGALAANALTTHTGMTTTTGLISVAGDFGGEVTLDEPLQNVSTSPLVVPPILIGGSFLDGALIDLPEEGLGGYILIEEGSEWEEGAVIAVGATDLEGPNYIVSEEELEDLGGASAAVAPFGLHRTLCDPQDDAYHLLHVSPSCMLEDPSCLEVLACVDSISEMRLVFRGPLTPIDLGGTPANAAGILVIQRRTLGPSMSVWASRASL